MKCSLVLFTLLFVSGFTVVDLGAQPLETAKRIEKHANPLFLSGFANKLDARLKGRSVGYAFAVIDNSGNVVGGGGGDARRAPDPNPRKMTMNDKLNIASVSKTITAAAV